MILDDFLYYDTNGLYCKYGDFYIDPQQTVKVAVISHAHADHAIAGNSEVYCTEATAAFMQLRYGKNADLAVILRLPAASIMTGARAGDPWRGIGTWRWGAAFATPSPQNWGDG